MEMVKTSKKENNTPIAIGPANAVKKPAPNPFFWSQIIEWGSFASAILILIGGGFFLLYPLFQKFQSIPLAIEKEKETFNKNLETYQNTARTLELYRQALADYSQELDIVSRSFWKTASTQDLRQRLEQAAKAAGVSISEIQERSDLTIPLGSKIFDVKINGASSALSSFSQSLETELPVILAISQTGLTEDSSRLTLALPIEPAEQNGEISVFNADLYSFPKFRIIKEYNESY